MKDLEKLKKLNTKKEKLEDKIDQLIDTITNNIESKIQLMKKIESDLIDKSNSKNEIRLPISTDYRGGIKPSMIRHIPDYIKDFTQKEDITIFHGKKYFYGCGDEYISIEIPTEYLNMSIEEIEKDYAKRFQEKIDNILEEENQKLLEKRKNEYEFLKRKLEEMEKENKN